MKTNNDKNESEVWPESIIKAYIDIMVDEVIKGNMKNGIYHSFIMHRLNSVTNRYFNFKQIKRKFNRLQSMYREFSLLLQHTGFGWDEKTNVVIASEDIWKSYIRAHPVAAQFQKKGCEYYKLLEIIFNRSVAIGVLHHSSTQNLPNTNEEHELENQHFNTRVHVDVDEDISNNVMQLDERTTHSGKHTIQVRESKPNKKSRTFQMGDRIQASKAKTKVSLANTERYRAKSMEVTSPFVLSDYCIAKCVIALDEIEDVSDDIYMKALQKFRKPDWREMFLTMSSDRRKAWLDRL